MSGVQLKIISWSVGQQSMREKREVTAAGFLHKVFIRVCVCECVVPTILEFWAFFCILEAFGVYVCVCPDGILTWLADF